MTVSGWVLFAKIKLYGVTPVKYPEMKGQCQRQGLGCGRDGSGSPEAGALVRQAEAGLT
jgi:hypothetical protein